MDLKEGWKFTQGKGRGASVCQANGRSKSTCVSERQLMGREKQEMQLRKEGMLRTERPWVLTFYLRPKDYKSLQTEGNTLSKMTLGIKKLTYPRDRSL